MVSQLREKVLRQNYESASVGRIGFVHLDGQITLISLQKGWNVYREFLGLPNVILHSGISDDILLLSLGTGIIQVLADHTDTTLSSFDS